MAVNVYKSTDVGAPSLTGQAGSLITVLDWCLVTGAGWTKTHTGTNKAVYQHAVGEAFYRFDDNGTAIAGTRRCKYRGYMTMDGGIDDTTGNQFPTTAQYNENILSILKSNLTDATAKPWWVYEDNGLFFLITEPNTAGSTYVRVFGKIASRKVGDQYNYVCSVSTTDSSYYDFSYVFGAYICIARTFDALTESVMCTSYSSSGNAGLSSLASSVNPCDNALSLGDLYLTENNVNGDGKNFIRGTIPGLTVPNEYLPWVSGDSMNNHDSTIDYDLFINHHNSSVKNCCCAVQTNGTWW